MRTPSPSGRSLSRDPVVGAVAAVAVAAVVLVASLLPVTAVGESSGPLGVDLLFHAVGYAALAAVSLRALDRARPSAPGRNAALAFAAAVGFGLLVELLQGTIPWRTLAAADAVANAVGAGVAVLALRLVGRRGNVSG